MPRTIRPEPTLSVVVCAYTMDRWQDLTAALDSLHRQTRPADEIILVIDHCPQLADRARAELPGARIVASRGRPGLSAARNTGIAEAHGEILAFLDDDATADPQWAKRLLAGYRDPRVLGVGGKIQPRWDRPRPAWFPTEFDWVVGCTYRGMPQQQAPVRNLLGANMSFRRDVLIDCGGFRTDLGRVGTRPLGCEETELCIRAARRHPEGVLLYDPEAAVRHHVPDRRGTWSYFRARCFAEGLSKAAVARRTGARQALSSERSYLTSTIPRAMLDALPGTRRRDGQRPSAATIPALFAGVAVTGLGYGLGRMRVLSRHTAETVNTELSTAPVPVPDLHADVPELLRHLHVAAGAGNLLDAYLAACGIDQVIDDRQRGTATLTRRTAVLAGANDIALRALDSGTAVTALGPAHRQLEAWHRRIQQLISVLADALLDDLDACDERIEAALAAVGETVPARAAHLLVGELMRPPACFRSFDQHPRDVEELIDRFAASYPDRARPLILLGVRTSGSYLAPLAAAHARALGYRDLTVRTIRPGERLMPGETRLLRRIRRTSGLVLALDDPPSSGRSLARVARAAENAGFDRDHVILAFAAFGGGKPRELAGRPCVILPGPDWHIRARLSPDALRRTVRALLPDDTPILAIAGADPGTPTRNGHLSVPLTVTIDTGDGPAELPLLAEGAGLGYLGRHAATLAAALTGTVPHVYGFDDGVLLRDRDPHAQPAVPADTVADYITARQHALPLPDDRSLLLAGREPVWEIGSRILAGTLGRLGTPLRPLLVEPIMRQLLRPEHPCIVDGRMLPWLWTGDGADGWHKTDFDDGSFSHLDLATDDAVYDLASAAVLAPEAEDKLIARYEQATGEHVTPARWCVHKLVAAWNIRRLKTLGNAAELAGADPTRIQDRAIQQFFNRLFLADLDDEPRGPWCVLDLDGVLETDLLGFPMTSPAGALALRALRAHGYRVLLATGRPLPDVQDRCANYRLPGAVAEYGAVTYNAATGETTMLAPEHDGNLAAELRALPGTDTDPRYRCCVRAFQRTGLRRTGLDPQTVRSVLSPPSPYQHAYTPVHGDAQTDFLPNGVTKSYAVRALTRLLGEPDVPVALAVGDSRTDIGMLQAARLGIAPANADRATMHTAGIERVASPYQAGLAQAVTRLIGHKPGSCPVCRAPDLEPAERALLALLCIPEAGRRGAPARMISLARARRATRTER